MIEFLSDVHVELVDSMGTDLSLVKAAMVSTKHETDNIPHSKQAGLINYLMLSRHGTPFEHGSMTFLVEAPIFVFREFHRHRIGFSYNEMSGRYTELESKFYLAGQDRPMINTGTSARPVMSPGSPELTQWFNGQAMVIYNAAWLVYKQYLAKGIAKEMARIVLPVGTFSRMFVTCNPRSLMAFLSLRVDDPDAMFPSKPQWEIQLAAQQLELAFAELYPITHEAFVNSRRVAP